MAVNLRREGTTLEWNKREISLMRVKELKASIAGYMGQKKNIPTGFEVRETYLEIKRKILFSLNATEAQWDNWQWQMANRIRDIKMLGLFVKLSQEQRAAIEEVGQQYRWAASPYYLALAITGGIHGPVWQQAIPSPEELGDDDGVEDPMGEAFTSPAPGITRRYPDRLIINVTNQCAMYCRHCQRRRNIGEVDRHKPKQVLESALQYIKANPEIRDVLITGGDALLLADRQLDWLLTELDNIPHVEIKRLGTRTPVTMPQRITPELCAILAKHPPIYINTQFNHPLEITPEAKQACDQLVQAGVVLGNQSVLLKHVNNQPDIMKRLNQSLLTLRVRPYYLFHAKAVKGTGHFITGVDEGLAIMEQLRGFTSGLAIPTYIINAPNGYGKTPISPQYLLENKNDQVTLRTWEKRVIPYQVGGKH